VPLRTTCSHLLHSSPNLDMYQEDRYLTWGSALLQVFLETWCVPWDLPCTFPCLRCPPACCTLSAPALHTHAHFLCHVGLDWARTPHLFACDASLRAATSNASSPAFKYGPCWDVPWTDGLPACHTSPPVNAQTPTLLTVHCALKTLFLSWGASVSIHSLKYAPALPHIPA